MKHSEEATETASLTSFEGMFAPRPDGGRGVRLVEIPLIQRDYAQGREDPAASLIRSDFLDVLRRALTGGEAVSLDFVYGEVDAKGTLRPLDGQQRLTTLFLLHWYLASRADRLVQRQGWKGFRYETRATARAYCERLVSCQPPPGVSAWAGWIRDQHWYRSTWDQDPTIQAMLVMVDAMHACFSGTDPLQAWERLVDPVAPAIQFHLLSTARLGDGAELYIKMNSRGRPLTSFESFKARFEQLIGWSGRAREFAEKIDGRWLDLFWRYRETDRSVDDELLRYLLFVTRLCELREALPAEELEQLETLSLDARARRAFGQGHVSAAANLEFLFQAFDVWGNASFDVQAWFQGVFAAEPPLLESADTSRVVIYDGELNLLSACCRTFGGKRGTQFTVGQTLLLYGVLIHRQRQTQNLRPRLRTLRNLVFASSEEFRPERMPALIGAVERLIELGELQQEGDLAFNAMQVREERRKRVLLAQVPRLERTLLQLEDHPVLRGSVGVLALEEQAFEARAHTFHRVFDRTCRAALGGALLACGDYSRQPKKGRRRLPQLASPPPKNEGSWRALLAGVGEGAPSKPRAALQFLLDAVAGVEGDLPASLERMQTDWLAGVEAAGRYDWRYYLVKYPVMRAGSSGFYASASGALGFDLCMLEGENLRGYYRDPYLTAIHLECGAGKAVHEPWFVGYETLPRWLRLERSEARLRCLESGFELEPPADPVHAALFAEVCARHGGVDRLLPVPQVEIGGSRFDTVDRVRRGAELVRALVEVGL